MALKERWPRIVQLLLDHRDFHKIALDLNATFDVGATALHYAAWMECGRSAQLLVAYPEVDVNARDDDGETPLHGAASTRVDSVIRELRKREDLNLEAVNHEGETPLAVAIKGGRAVAEKALRRSKPGRAVIYAGHELPRDSLLCSSSYTRKHT